jgi:DNA-binding transcriptional MerR regulator
MDEETKARVIEIVRDMSSQGLSPTDIAEQLRSMGIAEEDISEVMRDVGEPAPPAEEAPAESSALPEEHVERLHATVGELHEKQDMQSSDLLAIREDMERVKADLDEIKPLLAALKRLNENLMDVNKKMLVKYGASSPAPAEKPVVPAKKK